MLVGGSSMSLGQRVKLGHRGHLPESWELPVAGVSSEPARLKFCVEHSADTLRCIRKTHKSSRVKFIQCKKDEFGLYFSAIYSVLEDDVPQVAFASVIQNKGR